MIQYGQNKCPVLPNTQPGVDSTDPEVVDKAKKTYGYYYYTETGEKECLVTPESIDVKEAEPASFIL